MATDGTDDVVPTAPETPASDTGSQDEALQSDLEQGAEGDEGEQEEETEEIEYSGAKYRIPKPLKAGFMMQADYTRKTQEVAEHRRAIEEQRETFSKEMEARRASLKDEGQLAVMDDTLEQYQKVDWATWRTNDPDAANRAFQDYTLLRDRREQLAGKVKSDVETRKANEQQAFAKRYADTNAKLANEIEGWNQGLADKLRDFAIANGATMDDLRSIAVNATQVKLLHRAWLGEQLVAKQKAAAEKAAKTVAQPGEVEVKPLTEVRRRPTAAAKPGVHDDLPIDEWVRRERARVQKQRA